MESNHDPVSVNALTETTRMKSTLATLFTGAALALSLSPALAQETSQPREADPMIQETMPEGDAPECVVPVCFFCCTLHGAPLPVLLRPKEFYRGPPHIQANLQSLFPDLECKHFSNDPT